MFRFSALMEEMETVRAAPNGAAIPDTVLAAEKGRSVTVAFRAKRLQLKSSSQKVKKGFIRRKQSHSLQISIESFRHALLRKIKRGVSGFKRKEKAKEDCLTISEFQLSL